MMPYKRSIYRAEFDTRIDFLLKKCRRASRLRSADSDIRDMVFQCAILQTSAAIETYLKLLIEKWAQNVRTHLTTDKLPVEAKLFLVSKKLGPHFSTFNVNGEESKLIASLSKEDNFLWSLLIGSSPVPPLFEGRSIYNAATYPSYKNIKKLFARLGIQGIDHLISKNLRRDTETLIGNFQSIRTALAHSSPPAITVLDVENRLSDMRSLVGAIDRIFHGHVVKHGGTACWL